MLNDASASGRMICRDVIMNCELVGVKHVPESISNKIWPTLSEVRTVRFPALMFSQFYSENNEILNIAVIWYGQTYSVVYDSDPWITRTTMISRGGINRLDSCTSEYLSKSCCISPIDVHFSRLSLPELYNSKVGICFRFRITIWYKDHSMQIHFDDALWKTYQITRTLKASHLLLWGTLQLFYIHINTEFQSHCRDLFCHFFHFSTAPGEGEESGREFETALASYRTTK